MPYQHTSPVAHLLNPGGPLSDVSLLPKFGVVGPAAAQWLKTNRIVVPEHVYEVAVLHGARGLVARLPFDEFFIEDGPDGRIVPELALQSLSAPPRCYPYERQDAGFALTGARVFELLAQTCALDLRQEPDKLVMTRMAGVNVMLLWKPEFTLLRVWCLPGVAAYLWKTLLEIARELESSESSHDWSGEQA